MSARKKRLGELMGRLTKVTMTGPGPDAAVLAELKALRERVPQLTGALVASSDGLLIAHDLPDHIEPNGMAALAASQLALSYRLASTAHGGSFDEVVVHGSSGHVVVYAAGWSSLTVLAGPEANVGRLHLESRPVARAIAEHLTATTNGTHTE
ncbi:roadblock/LC7 domain-containing protein [Nocardia sp. CDC159]|uniref:Roadblock/LC7 domain-containing protein n=1 Tax=Nocardia pulmonis TaxID=2951408 RepID=A0A9X2ITR7_9NOCA|nr:MULTISPECIES: roadblock/LC7 domain-containing protein [Nocardia]MCM6772072.1 roadblock/LC7 domain-containing protein [Nocardia pulmonis]MCM6785270.1 roadblock/LC7 domain-containing protein [Nocardia sp. CDC159]